MFEKFYPQNKEFAEQFEKEWEENTYSIAQLQQFLMAHMDSPKEAVQKLGTLKEEMVTEEVVKKGEVSLEEKST